MKPKVIKPHTPFRIIVAAGALSFLFAVPSMGAVVGQGSAESDSTSASLALFEAIPAIEGQTAKTLTGVEVQQEASSVNVTITGDGTLVPEVALVEESRLVLDVPRVASAVRKPVMKVNHQILKRIRLGYHVDKVRVVFDLGARSTHLIETSSGSIVVRLKADQKLPGAAEPGERHDESIESVSTAESVSEFPTSMRVRPSVQKTVRQSHRFPVGFQVRPVQMMGEAEGGEKHAPKEDLVLGETHYVGRRISLDFQQADISNVLRLIAEVSGFNIVVGEGVKSKVTMKLVSVPWDQALDMILKMNGLGKIKQGNILWIDSLSNIAKQEDDEARAKDAKIKAEPLVDRVFYIRNLQATELMTSLRQNLSSRGTMQISQGTNALIVRDTESKMDVLKQLIDGLDLQVPQVQIEARIVQADTTYSRSLGVQWGVQNVNQLGPSFGVANFKSGTVGAFGNQTSDFLVNLPATVGGLVATPGVGFTFGRTDGALLDVRLSAGELLGLSKVIAAPKVTTLDKREAKISQGESIPFQTTSLQGTQTTFVDANLELNVTPQITSRDPKEVGKQILMRVRATRNAVGARSNPAGPSIDRREANTQVIIRDGETMVIGGVFIDTQNNNVAGIPYLSRVPVLGWLFKQKSETVAKQELLIFMTPTIVKTL
jgi:type IV pilus assembly protein PilQ